MYLQSSESAILTPGVTQDLKTAWLEEEAISWQFSGTELEQFLQSEQPGREPVSNTGYRQPRSWEFH